MTPPIMLGIAAAIALLMKSMGNGKPQLTVLQGGKSSASAPPAKPKAKAKPSKPRALVLTPAASAASAPVVDLAQTSAAAAMPPPQPDDVPAPEKLAPPKKPPRPRKPKGSPPTAAKLAKPAKRTGRQAANDLRDYLDGGGNPGSRSSRSDFVRAAQRDMGSLNADGVYGPKTRARAKALGVDIQH